MKKLLTCVLLSMVLSCTTVHAAETRNARATCVNGFPSEETTIKQLRLGTTKVTLKNKGSVEGWTQFVLPDSGRYVFVFSDINTELENTNNRHAIFCFYNKWLDKLYIDGLKGKFNGFALGYNRASSIRTRYKNKIGVSVVGEVGDVVNICCSNILKPENGSVASYAIEIYYEGKE